MKYNSGRNRASNFKSAEHVAQGTFEITSTIIPELYDNKFKTVSAEHLSNKGKKKYQNSWHGNILNTAKKNLSRLQLPS